MFLRSMDVQHEAAHRYLGMKSAFDENAIDGDLRNQLYRTQSI